MIDPYIRQYGKRLYGLCLALCRNSFDADDLYQDTWLKVLRYIGQYHPDMEFEPWLTAICVNTYRNLLRRAARSPVIRNLLGTEETQKPLEQIPASETPDYSSLYAAVDELPEKLRLAVILFYFQDMELNAAAKALGIPPGTMKSRLNSARKKLKEALKDEADLPF